MDRSYWFKQGETPLFPDIDWSRPESKATSGKLTIIGGNAHNFHVPAKSYEYAQKAGIGALEVVLPESLRKITNSFFPEATYAPTTPSGSFEKKSLAMLIEISQWADGTLLAGDFGRNSETAMLLENFVQKAPGLLCVSHDATDYFREHPLPIVNRELTIIAATTAQLQKIFIHTPTITPIVSSMGIIQLVDALHDYTTEHKALIITKYGDFLVVAHGGNVSTTPYIDKLWRTQASSYAVVYSLQQPPSKLFEAVTTALFRITH